MGTRLFVGGLSWGTDDAGLRAAFDAFGDLTDCRVVLDRETGRSRGFGFVGYATEDQAKAALAAMDGAEVDGRRIRVNEAEERGGGPRRGPPGPAQVDRRPSGGRPPGPPGPPRRPSGGYGGGPPRGFDGPPPDVNFGPPPTDDPYEGKPGASRRRGKKGKKREEHDPWGGGSTASGRGRKGKGRRGGWSDWDEEG